jgi:hypothetical protein
MQSDPSQGRGTRYLRKSEAQTEAGIREIADEVGVPPLGGNTCKAGTANLNPNGEIWLE